MPLALLLGPLESLALWYPWPAILALLAVAYVTGIRIQGSIAREHLRTPVTPKQPILAWEKAETKARMDEILAAWGEEGRRWAKRTLVWDVLFLLSYGAVLSLASTMAAVFYRGADAWVGEAVYGLAAWAAVLAAFLDGVENLLLFRLLEPFEGEGLPKVMVGISKAKWAVILALVPLALVGMVVFLLGCLGHC